MAKMSQFCPHYVPTLSPSCPFHKRLDDDIIIMDDEVATESRVTPKWPPNDPQVYPKCTFAGDFDSGIIKMSKKNVIFA